MTILLARCRSCDDLLPVFRLARFLEVVLPHDRPGTRERCAGSMEPPGTPARTARLAHIRPGPTVYDIIRQEVARP